jgi:sulfate transport system permease protein
MKRVILPLVVVTYVGLLVGLPVIFLLTRTFAKGISPFLTAISQPDAIHAVILSVTVAVIVVALNTVIGLATALLLARRSFRGARILDVTFDVPVAVSPVVIGVALVLAYSRIGWFGHPLAAWGVSVLFSPTGIVLASVAITLPYVLRSTLPILVEAGTDQEQAARTLGASPLRVFFTITLPTIRWGVLYGVTLTVLRTLGEFGAVLVVSGNVTGVTQTVPIYIFDRWDQNFDVVGSFAGAFELAVISFLFIGLLAVMRRRERRRHVINTH